MYQQVHALCWRWVARSCTHLSDRVVRRWSSDYATSAGAIAILRPTITALVLVLAMGVNAIATGVFDLITVFRLRLHIRGIWWLYLNGVLSLMFGGLVLA